MDWRTGEWSSAKLPISEEDGIGSRIDLKDSEIKYCEMFEQDVAPYMQQVYEKTHDADKRKRKPMPTSSGIDNFAGDSDSESNSPKLPKRDSYLGSDVDIDEILSMV